MAPPYYSPYKLGDGKHFGLVPGRGRTWSEDTPPGVPGSCKIDDVAKGYADDAIIVLGRYCALLWYTIEFSMCTEYHCRLLSMCSPEAATL
jgi:hypothetical protein